MSRGLLVTHRRITKDWSQSPIERYHNPNGGPRYIGVSKETVTRVLEGITRRDVKAHLKWLKTRWKGIKCPTPTQIETMRYE